MYYSHEHDREGRDRRASLLSCQVVLQLAGLGIAVANAGAPTKAAADVVLEETNDQDAVAHAIEKFILSQA